MAAPVRPWWPACKSWASWATIPMRPASGIERGTGPKTSGSGRAKPNDKREQRHQLKARASRGGPDTLQPTHSPKRRARARVVGTPEAVRGALPTGLQWDPCTNPMTSSPLGFAYSREADLLHLFQISSLNRINSAFDHKGLILNPSKT